MEKEKVDVSKDELDRQLEYINLNRVKIENIFPDRKPKATINTYGCAMNAHDSEKLIGMLTKMGYEIVEDEENSDLIIYNTCCVRENAENKVYGNLGFLKRIKEKNKNLKIVLCGCMMQQDSVIETIRKKYKHVDIIFGTFNLYRFPELLNTSFETGGMIIDVWKEHKEIIEDLPTKRLYPYKSSVNIMYGCNNFCTYCIVPYVRGRERSRSTVDIIAEVKELVADNVKEIVLLGQNVNSYGKDLTEDETFPNLLRELNEIDGLERIRFMTSHPKDISDELLYVMRDCEKVCNNLHLPVQAGSNDLLKRMNRNYTREKYLDTIKKAKELMPDITISTDLIIGFPGETEEEFLETLELVKEVEYYTAFTFIYSKREGTPAAKMEDVVDEKTAKDRFNRLLDVLKPISLSLNKRMVGKTVKVLVEEESKQDSEFMSGRSEGNIIVHVKGDKSLIGQILEVEVVDCKTFYLIGKIKE